MLNNISNFLILGKPLIMYGGILTLIAFIITALTGYLTLKGKVKYKWHNYTKIVAFILAIIHGTLGILYFF